MTTDYKLLSDADKAAVREKIKPLHEYFYHGTTKGCLAGIKLHGLDPEYEHDDNEYFWERLEPARALRYCTKAELRSAHGAAEERARWRDSSDPSNLDTANVVLFRVKAENLLKKSFGLDHAFFDEQTIKRSMDANGLLLADTFIELFNGCGLISCYETIPAEELEIYSGSFYNDFAALKDTFIPL